MPPFQAYYRDVTCKILIWNQIFLKDQISHFTNFQHIQVLNISEKSILCH